MVGGSFAGLPIYSLGTDIQWNLNKLEVLPGKTNLPVIVTWYAAIVFAQNYGYDLPTDAEWEKAARGADHDGLGEHQIYPWGNAIFGGNANYSGSGQSGRTPVGYFNGAQFPTGPDMANGYGLYDVGGNASEWTRTGVIQSDAYPSTESPANGIHSLYVTGDRSVRGGSSDTGPDGLRCYRRAITWQYAAAGFRVARRSP